VLIHLLTDDSVDDHSRYVLLLGPQVAPKRETLRCSCRAELLPAVQMSDRR
jgi:aromatic ring-cleaving dioxygenase